MWFSFICFCNSSIVISRNDCFFFLHTSIIVWCVWYVECEVLVFAFSSCLCISTSTLHFSFIFYLTVFGFRLLVIFLSDEQKRELKKNTRQKIIKKIGREGNKRKIHKKKKNYCVNMWIVKKGNSNTEIIIRTKYEISNEILKYESAIEWDGYVMLLCVLYIYI